MLANTRIQIAIQYLRHKLRFITCNRLIILSLFIAALLKFRNLGHKTIKYWDELFHAIAARNLTKHFFMPTLYDQPYLPYDYKNWTHNHIWLHKPPYPLWQIAISYRLFGVNSFALRLPSVIMAGLAVFITYLIGSELYNKKVGFVAAFLQAVNPLMMNLVHGYMFSDHIDIALVFWVELSCYLLIKGVKTGKTRYYIWSGVAQGFGYLSKSYLCLVGFGIAGVIFILTRTGVLKPYKGNISAKKVLAQLLFSILVAAPWVTFCLIKYTKEFIHENNMVLAHLYTQVEIWQKPWDCHLFEYMPSHYPYWYLIIFVSFFFLSAFAMKGRTLSDLYIILWVIIVVLPLSMSVSKVPAGTDIATPALLICFAAGYSRIIGGNYDVSAVGYFALVFSLFFLSQWPFHLFDGMKEATLSYIQRISALQRIAPSLYASAWIIYQFLCFFAAFVLSSLIYIGLRWLRNPLWRRRYVNLLKVVAAIMLIALVYPLTLDTVRITDEKPVSDDYGSDSYYMDGFEDIGSYIKEKLPKNSAILLESSVEYDRHYLMFFADRSTYHLVPQSDDTWTPRDDSSTITIKNNGGIPYLVSTETHNYPLVYESPVKPHYRIYSLQ